MSSSLEGGSAEKLAAPGRLPVIEGARPLIEKGQLNLLSYVGKWTDSCRRSVENKVVETPPWH
jgi:hypothetical protein